MELLGIISVAEKFLCGYATFCLRTLAHPIEQFSPLNTDDTSDTATKEGLQRLSLDLAFVIFSIFIGSILNSFVPSRKYSCDIVGKVIVVLMLWINFADYTHVLCRYFCGKAELEQTLWVSLQVSAVLYVVSSFINLVGGFLVILPQVSSSLVSIGQLGNSIANNPFYLYFLVQFALLNVYLPLVTKKINGFGSIRPIMVGIALSIFWVCFGIIFSELSLHTLPGMLNWF